jgi:hypothetical protein
VNEDQARRCLVWGQIVVIIADALITDLKPPDPVFKVSGVLWIWISGRPRKRVRPDEKKKRQKDDQ